MIHDRSGTSLWYRVITCAPRYDSFSRRHGDIERPPPARASGKRSTGKRRWQAEVSTFAVALRPKPACSHDRSRQLEIEFSRPNRRPRVAYALRRRIRFRNLCRADKFYQASVASVPRTLVNHAGSVMRSRGRRGAIGGRISRTTTYQDITICGLSCHRGLARPTLQTVGDFRNF